MQGNLRYGVEQLVIQMLREALDPCMAFTAQLPRDNVDKKTRENRSERNRDVFLFFAFFFKKKLIFVWADWRDQSLDISITLFTKAVFYLRNPPIFFCSPSKGRKNI